MGLVRQHLIDPEICIRCNTCEEICPIDAITHDDRNYVVKFDVCNFCNDCLSPCPTGAIDSWRQVTRPWTVEEQLAWDALPDDAAPSETDEAPALPPEVERLARVASEGEGGRVVPPYSAAHPYVGLFTPERPAVARVQGVRRLTDENAGSDIRHIVLDLGRQAFPVLEGQSVGVIPPGRDENGRPHHVRLYSVASPRDGERPGFNNLSLTVKRVVEDEHGNPVHGVASNYLCDLERGDEVRLTGPYGTTFLMPNNWDADIVMICTGTGAAPFRAMTEWRRRHRPPDARGRLYLFFGARTPGELPYFGPLMKLPKDLIDVELAFSRIADQPKQYVQDRMRARADDLARLLAGEETYIYLCGHKRMEDGVHAAFREVAAAHGMDWDAMVPELRASGRFHVETYY